MTCALQVGALTKLKRLSSSRLRNASGGSPRVQAGSEAAQPDHFAAALEKLRRDQQAEQTSKQQGKQQSAGQHSLAHAAGERRPPCFVHHDVLHPMPTSSHNI